MISILRLALLLVFKFTPSLTLWLVHFSLDLFPWRWQHHDNPGLTDVKIFLVETLAGLKVCKGPAKKKKKEEWMSFECGLFFYSRGSGRLTKVSELVSVYPPEELPWRCQCKPTLSRS